MTTNTTDYRTMFDRDYIGAWDLPRDATVTIVKVEPRKLKSQRGENTKPILFFDGKDKAMVCNKTNAKTIAGLYGNDTRKWIGQKITLYATTTSAGGETVECIRVRPTAPKPSAAEGKGGAQKLLMVGVEREAGSDG